MRPEPVVGQDQWGIELHPDAVVGVADKLEAAPEQVSAIRRGPGHAPCGDASVDGAAVYTPQHKIKVARNAQAEGSQYAAGMMPATSQALTAAVALCSLLQQ